MRQGLGSVVFVLALASGAPGCCFTGAGTPPSTGSASAPTQPTAESAGETERRRLEGFLRDGVGHGDGEGAQAIALVVHEVLEPRDSVVVRTSTPGAPRRIVVLVKFDDDATEGLANLDDARRTEYLDGILAALDEDFAAGSADVGIAIRGTWAYGGGRARRGGRPAHYDTRALASTEELDALLGEMR
jgi:hypothetical protein